MLLYADEEPNQLDVYHSLFTLVYIGKYYLELESLLENLYRFKLRDKIVNIQKLFNTRKIVFGKNC